MLSCMYSHHKISIPQQFKKIRNSILLTKHTLNQYFDSNEVQNTVFNESDPNVIANILISELSIIIKSIEPSKIIQCTNSYCLWVTDKFNIESNNKVMLKLWCKNLVN